MRWCIVMWVLCAGCHLIIDIPPAVVTEDAPVPDAAPDGGVDAPPEPIPRDCKMIHVDAPAKISATYTIDPDGEGGMAPVDAFCEMETAGGGWTVVFVAKKPNYLNDELMSYLVDSQALRDAASDTLIGYRDAATKTLAGWATFHIPDQWRLTTPFSVQSVTVRTDVSVGGAPAKNETLHFGYADFLEDECKAAWNIDAKWGRICIDDTGAPFYNGWASGVPDYCTTSTSRNNTNACSLNPLKFFFIAMR